MKLLTNLILPFLLFLTSCNSETEINQVDKTETQELLLTSSSTLEEALKTKISGIDFSIVLHESGDTTFWQTTDSRFITTEGYRVGNSWNDIPNELKSELIMIPGWGYFINLDSGWTIAFCEGSTCTEQMPSSESKIDWIFKKK